MSRYQIFRAPQELASNLLCPRLQILKALCDVTVKESYRASVSHRYNTLYTSLGAGNVSFVRAYGAKMPPLLAQSPFPLFLLVPWSR